MRAVGLVRRLGAPALLGLLAAIFFHEVLFGGQVLLPTDQLRSLQPWASELGPPATVRQWDALAWDAMAQYYPWRAFLGERLRAGELPLWNPRELLGTPFLANGQSAVLYPPNWLFGLLDPAVALGWSAWLHFLLGGLFTYWLLRELGVRPSSALASGVAFMFSGYMVGMCELPTFICVAVWLPAGLVCLLRARHPSGGLWALPLGGAVGMAVLGGHLQITAYVMLALLAAMVILFAFAFRRPSWARPGRIALRCGAGLAIGLLIGSAQLLPTIELARLGHRGLAKPTMDQFRWHQLRAFTLDQWMLLVAPDANGNPADNDFTGFYSYGEHCGYSGLLTLALAVLALCWWRRPAVYLAGALTVGALLAASGTVVAMALFFLVPGLGSAGGFARIFCLYDLGLAALAGLGLERVCRAVEARKGAGLAQGLAAAAVVIIALDLFHFGMRFNPTGPREDVYPETPLIRQMRQQAGDGRILAVNDPAKWTLLSRPEALLPPNAAMVYGLRDVGGYDSLFPAATKRLLARTEGRDPSPLANGNMVLIQNVDSDGVDVLGCRYVLTTRALEGHRWVLEGSNGTVNLYRNTRAWPAAFQPPFTHPSGLPDAAGAVRCTANSVEVECTGADRDLAVSDTYYPGWRAAVNGRLVQIAPWEVPLLLLRGPIVRGRVDFVYVPTSFQVGLFLALVALAVCAGCAVASRGRRRAPAQGCPDEI